jgi:hypothetical protein
MALELPALVTDRVEEDTMSTTIKIAAGWDGNPKSLTSPEHNWIRFLEAQGIAYPAYLDEPAGWRLVVCDERRLTRALHALRKYGVYGICEWTYDIH